MAPLLKTYRGGRQPARENLGNMLFILIKEPKIEPGTDVPPINDMADISTAPSRPKDEPYDDDSIGFKVPIAVMFPPHPIPYPIPNPIPHPIPLEDTVDQDEISQDDSMMNASTSQANVVEAPTI